jgi:leucyl-tRNA synthetase
MPVDHAALQTSSISMVVQVNGKLRGHITVAVGAAESAVRDAAMAEPHVRKFLGAAAVRKLIIVPGKLVNIVV